MFSVFVNAVRVKDIRKKLLYTVMVIAIYRFGTTIIVPGAPTGSLTDETGALNFAQMLLGGGSNVLSIFALGIGPYITASIIMQLLTVAIPKLEQMQKEGEEGRRKINNITRYLAVVMSFLQASATVYNYHGYLRYQNFFMYAVAVICMVAGTSFIMWLSEQITAKGMGNGSSMLIFANILASLPMAVTGLIGIYQRRGMVGLGLIIGLLIVFIIVIAFVVFVQQGERRLPVQYSKRVAGRKTFGGQSSFIPIKVNIAGVISIIFAISLIQFPQVLGGFFGLTNGPKYSVLLEYLNIHHWVGALLYVLLIFFFTFFYTDIVFNPIEIAENMKKSGGLIPGVRPGQPTSTYIRTIVKRVTWIGAVFYALIAVFPILVGWAISETSVGFGGTTIIIVVGVALDTVKQIESQLLMRHYKGFLND